MKYTRSAVTEGRDMILVVIIMLSAAFYSIYYFDLSVLWTIVCTILVLIYSVFLISPIIKNIASKGVFLCELTNDEFTQSVPISSYGDSFHIRICDITQIELEHNDSNPKWYIHTQNQRLQVSSLYGNPDREFGELLIKKLPHIGKINT